MEEGHRISKTQKTQQGAEGGEKDIDRVDPDTIMHRIASRAPGEARHAINFSLVDFVLLRGIIWKGRGTKERKNEGAGART